MLWWGWEGAQGTYLIPGGSLPLLPRDSAWSSGRYGPHSLWQGPLWGLLEASCCCRCCCSVIKSCPTLCDSWTAARQAPLSFPISWTLLNFMSIESVTLPNHILLFCPLLLCLQSFPSSGSFPMTWLFASGSQSTRSASDTYI